MGDIAEHHVSMFTSGRWGTTLPPQREHPKTTKAAIAGQMFSIVAVTGGRTNRPPGTVLVVCERDKDFYWVWASNGVTGILKECCTVRASDLSLNEALVSLGRKTYGEQTPC